MRLTKLNLAQRYVRVFRETRVYLAHVYVRTRVSDFRERRAYLAQNEHADKVEENSRHDTGEQWRQEPGGNWKTKKSGNIEY